MIAKSTIKPQFHRLLPHHDGVAQLGAVRGRRPLTVHEGPKPANGLVELVGTGVVHNAHFHLHIGANEKYTRGRGGRFY